VQTEKTVAEPDVSVVVGVHNGMPALVDTVGSVLSQVGVELELVVVDDGSTDRSASFLEAYAARDSRVRVLRQEHAGLTRALIRGCAVARGEYIAREDVGDVSLPGRLQRERECLKARPDAVFVSCGTRFVGPGGEHLYDVVRGEAEIVEALRSQDSEGLRTPGAHGSVMFRRAAYEKVGGYRPEFYFAQDLDLWVRLAEIGNHAVIAEILFQTATAPGSLSGMHRREQLALTELIAESAHRRRAGMPDADVLVRAAAIRPAWSARARRLARSKALYFIVACLRRRRDAAATRYFVQALCENPLHLKAWWRLLSAR
jgi:glycosyltransferase involved in cell wall biosynthesis